MWNVGFLVEGGQLVVCVISGCVVLGLIGFSLVWIGVSLRGLGFDTATNMKPSTCSLRAPAQAKAKASYFREESIVPDGA